MIPKIIHYCWFGNGNMPQLALDCIASWHKYMPDWQYIQWDESNFDVNSTPYTKEAYEAKKYAFVSDYARLYALEKYGGVYLDVDFEVFKPFDPLLDFTAFAGYEGSKHSPVMMGVLASEPGGEWIRTQLHNYEGRHFIKPDGTPDFTTIVVFITGKMAEKGFISNGLEQNFGGLHVFPVDYFCPRQTTGEYFRTDNTYCDHKDLNSWSSPKEKPFLLRLVGEKNSIRLIKIKRKIFG